MLAGDLNSLLHNFLLLYQKHLLVCIFMILCKCKDINVNIYLFFITGYKLAFNYLKAKRFVDAIDVCHKVCGHLWCSLVFLAIHTRNNK